jgi:hypothetical protein
MNAVAAFGEITGQVDRLVREYIDVRAPHGSGVDSDRYQLAVEAGRALVLLGASLLGNALGIKDPSLGLTPAFAMLDQLKQIAEAQRAANPSG